MNDVATKQDIKDLEMRQDARFDRLEGKVDYIVNPRNGMWAELAKVNNKGDKAHERIDKIEAAKSKKQNAKYKLYWLIAGAAVSGIISLIGWILRDAIL